VRISLLIGLLLALQPKSQDISPWADPSKSPIILSGKIVRYDPFQFESADLILRTPQGKFVRLLYSPHDWGFDAPHAKPEQMIPQEMIFNGKLDWRFRAHLLRTEQHKLFMFPNPENGPSGG
jgi:hypothetical protein